MSEAEEFERPYVCDACGVRAWVEVFIGSILNCFLYCGHCYGKQEASLEARDDVVMIIDNRGQINAKPDPDDARG